MTTDIPKIPKKATKAEVVDLLENEMRLSRLYRNKLEDLREAIPMVLAEKIEEYGLELCDDGVEDFCEVLGAKWEPRREFCVDITLSGVVLPRHGGDSPTRAAAAQWEQKIREAIYNLDPSIEITFENYEEDY